ncbi:MAG: hypothetical protein IPP34_10815 [Bacteroidetes bacterium]|nr:hypothetical protein [Bacteroidota bacterium]
MSILRIVPTTAAYQVYSPTLHNWVKDSTISNNGVSTLTLLWNCSLADGQALSI